MQAIVIDDSRAMRVMLKRILMGMGFDVREAGDGKDALVRVAEGTQPKLALVDWNMPNMNGYEFVKAIRQNHSYDGMKIVMVTTEVEMHQMQAALQAGANEYVMKPFTEDVLRERIQMMGLTAEAA